MKLFSLVALLVFSFSSANLLASTRGKCTATSFLPKSDPNSGLQQAEKAACESQDMEDCLQAAFTECYLDSGDFTQKKNELFSGNGEGMHKGEKGFFGFCTYSWKCDTSWYEDASKKAPQSVK